MKDGGEDMSRSRKTRKINAELRKGPERRREENDKLKDENEEKNGLEIERRG
jgi:hypothetical protein